MTTIEGSVCVAPIFAWKKMLLNMTLSHLFRARLVVCLTEKLILSFYSYIEWTGFTSLPTVSKVPVGKKHLPSSSTVAMTKVEKDKQNNMSQYVGHKAQNFSLKCLNTINFPAECPLALWPVKYIFPPRALLEVFHSKVSPYSNILTS